MFLTNSVQIMCVFFLFIQGGSLVGQLKRFSQQDTRGLISSIEVSLPTKRLVGQLLHPTSQRVSWWSGVQLVLSEVQLGGLCCSLTFRPTFLLHLHFHMCSRTWTYFFYFPSYIFCVVFIFMYVYTIGTNGKNSAMGFFSDQQRMVKIVQWTFPLISRCGEQASTL